MKGSSSKEGHKILGVVVAGLIAGALLGIGVQSSADAGSAAKFSAPPTAAAGIFTWGIQKELVALPDGVRFSSSPNEDPIIDMVHLADLPVVLRENANAQILPYQIRWPDDQKVYVRKNSGIRTPSDLDGKRLGVLAGPASQAVIRFLEREYGVSRTNLETETISVMQAQNLSEWRDLDAVVLRGNPPTGSVRSVLRMQEEFENRFGETGLPVVFVIGDSSYRETGEAVVAAVNKSVQLAAEQPGQVKADIAADVGVPLQTLNEIGVIDRVLAGDGSFLIAPMTEARLTELQYRMELYSGEDPPKIADRLAAGAE